MNRRVYSALRKVASEKFEGIDELMAPHPVDAEILEYAKSKPYLRSALNEINERVSRPHSNDDMVTATKKVIDFLDKGIRAPFALDAMKVGKTIGAGTGGILGVLAGLKLAKDKSTLQKILYSGGLGLLSAGAGAALGDTVADYTA